MNCNDRVRIAFLIHDVSRLGRTVFDQRLRRLAITQSQWWVLIGVSRHGDLGITQTELARVLDLGKVALGSLVDRLVEHGYVERRADAYDRRVHRVFTTRKGHAILERMKKIGTELNTKIMRGISLEHQDILSRMLTEMKGNLIALDAIPGAKKKCVA